MLVRDARLTQEGADDLLNKHRLGVYLIEISVVVEITVALIAFVLRMQMIGDLVERPAVAGMAVVPVADVGQLLRPAERQTGIVLFRKARRTNAASIERIEPSKAIAGYQAASGFPGFVGLPILIQAPLETNQVAEAFGANASVHENTRYGGSPCAIPLGTQVISCTCGRHGCGDQASFEELDLSQ